MEHSDPENRGSCPLPDEIWNQIISYLEPYNLTKLQQVSKGLQQICLDDTLWRHHCFDKSAWYQNLNRQRNSSTPFPFNNRPRDRSGLDDPAGAGGGTSADLRPESTGDLRQYSRRLQDLANWDPSFPGEKVSWYDEYIQREGPASVNWLQTPKVHDPGVEAIIEARGVALYSPYDGDDGIGTKLAVSPLDDGSVCLWDINGSRGRQGGILAKSQGDLLYMEGSRERSARLRSQRIDSSIADRVSVDNQDHRAYFAVQSHLIEVDLNRLEVTSRDSFEWSITTLSAIHPGMPLVVGTSLGVHLHDRRVQTRISGDVAERVESRQPQDLDVFKAIFDANPLPPYAPLSQPTPTSIVYLPRADQNTNSLVTDDIYVSGRFSNILHFDRRKFPAIVNSIHSGAVVHSLAALPYPFSTVDHEVRQRAESSAEGVAQMKSRAGSALIAGGSYNNKGSLEVYGLTPSVPSPGGRGTMMLQSLIKNRQTAASSPILSVANHGTKVVFSDGSGLIKWFERDGNTECRRLRLGHSEADGASNMFTSQLDDVARKVVSTRTKHGKARPNNDNVLLWTGERLGLVSFTTSPLYLEKDFVGDHEAPEAEDEARQEYADKMREALERQAGEARFLSSLGIGTESSFGL